MVVDTSALVAIFLLEPEAEQFAHAILEAPRATISAANLLEVGIILDSRIGHQESSELDEFILNVGLEVEPVSLEQVRIARHASPRVSAGALIGRHRLAIFRTGIHDAIEVA